MTKVSTFSSNRSTSGKPEVKGFLFNIVLFNIFHTKRIFHSYDLVTEVLFILIRSFATPPPYSFGMCGRQGQAMPMPT
jgi:hypothetical protein